MTTEQSPRQLLMQDLLDGFAHGAVLFDAQDRLVAFNSAYARMCPGIAAALRPGMPFRACVELAARLGGGLTDPAAIEAWIESRLRERREGDRKAEIRTPSGIIATVQEQALPHGGWMLTYRDVTLERKLEKELQATRDHAALLALVAESTDNAVIITDRYGRIEWVNAGFTRLTGYSLEEAVGRAPGSLLRGPETDPAIDAVMRDAVVAGRGFKVEVLNYTKLRETYWCAIECVPIRNAAGEVERFIAIELDITQRREQQKAIETALDQARKAAEQQRQFVSIAAHEFRTPLAIIDGAAQRLMARGEGMAESAATYLPRIRSSVRRMVELIDSTLNSERLEQGRLELTPTRLDLAELVEMIARRFEGLMREFRVVVERPPAPVLMVGDPRLLEQVFTNLLSNAIKFSGSHREVNVDVEEDPAGVRVSVRDRGVGIPPDELDKLFTRFFRASTARGIAGTGIGLHLVRDLVTMHHGTIAVSSELGRGTRFDVRLPLDFEASKGASSPPTGRPDVERRSGIFD